MSASSAPRRAPRPIHLIGGGDRSARKGADPLLEAAFAEAGTPHPSIAYVGAASDDDRTFFRWIADAFRRSGAGEVRLAALASRRADVAEARAVLSEADIVFVSGGDVEAGMAHLDRHALGPFLARLHRDGKPFFGVSAGSIILARSWVRWNDPDDDGSAATFPCLGLADVLCDTHAEGDGWEELRILLALAGDAVGYGIPTGGALRVAPDGSVTALGKPAVRLTSRSGRVPGRGEMVPA